MVAPYPASAFAAGDLVAGFPTEVIGPLPGADVVESSISSGEDRMQSTLVARTDAPAPEVVAYYRDLWTSLGRAPSAQAGQEALSFSGDFDSLTLAVEPSTGTGTMFVVSAAFHSG